MTVTLTTRLGLKRWSDDEDPWSRADFDANMAQLEALSAIAVQGLASARPATGVDRRLYLATDTRALSYDTGAAWLNVAHDTMPPMTPVFAPLQPSFPGNLVVKKRAGIVFLNLNVTTTGSVFGGTPIAFLASAYWPERQEHLKLRFDAGSANNYSATIEPGGTVVLSQPVGLGGTFTGTVSYPAAS